MRVTVDADRCEGHARCWGICPEVFDLDDEGHDVADVIGGPQRPDGAHDGVDDDDRAPERSGAVAVVDVGGGEDQADTASCCAVVLPTLVAPDRLIPQVSSPHSARIGPANPASTPKTAARDMRSPTTRR